MSAWRKASFEFEAERHKVAKEKRRRQKERAASLPSSSQTFVCLECGRACASKIGLYSHQRACENWKSTFLTILVCEEWAMLSLCLWRHEQGRHVCLTCTTWRAHFFCSSLEKSKPIWLYLEKLEFEAETNKQKRFCCTKYGHLPLWSLRLRLRFPFRKTACSGQIMFDLSCRSVSPV